MPNIIISGIYLDITTCIMCFDVFYLYIYIRIHSSLFIDFWVHLYLIYIYTCRGSQHAMIWQFFVTCFRHNIDEMWAYIPERSDKWTKWQSNSTVMAKVAPRFEAFKWHIWPKQLVLIAQCHNRSLSFILFSGAAGVLGGCGLNCTWNLHFL